KKTFIIKALKVVAPSINLEGNIVLDVVTFNAGPTNSLPTNYNTPIIANTLEKVRKYLIKENLNKKGAAIVYFRPFNGFI
ncbi:hypothetical protein NEUTE1DRAFT_54148, partial [Neurospora tetrasperma FGSC 2508]